MEKEKIVEPFNAVKSGEKAMETQESWANAQKEYLQKRLTWAPNCPMSNFDQNYLLIKEVKLHPCLYDPKYEKFNDSRHTTEIWAEIEKKLNSNNNVEKIINAKRRFASLYKKFCDVYVFLGIPDKVRHSQPASKFHYYREMEFLKNTIDANKKRAIRKRFIVPGDSNTSQIVPVQKRPAEDGENGPPKKIMKTSSPQESQEAESPAPNSSQSIQINPSVSEANESVKSTEAAPDLPCPEAGLQFAANLSVDNNLEAPEVDAKSLPDLSVNKTQSPEQDPESSVKLTAKDKTEIPEEGSKFTSDLTMNSTQDPKQGPEAVQTLPANNTQNLQEDLPANNNQGPEERPQSTPVLLPNGIFGGGSALNQQQTSVVRPSWLVSNVCGSDNSLGNSMQWRDSLQNVPPRSIVRSTSVLWSALGSSRPPRNRWNMRSNNYQGSASPEMIILPDSVRTFRRNFQMNPSRFPSNPQGITATPAMREQHIDFFFRSVADEVKRSELSDSDYLKLQHTILNATINKPKM
ncbi:uncharacterized protein LOC132259723 [Phlebotomus argentipes]|uniref:uncharacterized protein LOC132259723 n=1 Tax=Phlebotomus argentipes TaxID=94469 RepID=UPI0028937354|nr:uncharacterized protein LOC132259723 [Phlebotomus argentipes]